jgi:hypothetical protein
LKKRILFPIVAIGLLTGFVLASLLWPVPSRAERLAALFTGYCLPHHRGEDVIAKAAANLALHKRSPSSSQWIDQVSGSFLIIKANYCMVATYHPFALSAADAKELLKLTTKIVAEEFPDLAVDPLLSSSNPDVLELGWMVGKFQSPKRWGVFFSAQPNLGQGSNSSLMLTSPTG